MKPFTGLYDTSGELTPEEQSLDETCLEFMKTYQADLSLLAITLRIPGRYDSFRPGSFLLRKQRIRLRSRKSGFQLIWVKSTDQALIEAYGDAADLIPQDYLQFAAREIPCARKDTAYTVPCMRAPLFVQLSARRRQGDCPCGDNCRRTGAAAAGNTGDESVDPESSRERDSGRIPGTAGKVIHRG